MKIKLFFYLSIDGFISTCNELRMIDEKCYNQTLKPYTNV